MFQYIKRYWYFALLAPVFMVGEVMMDLVQPQLMSKIVDEGVLGLSNNNVGDLHLVIAIGIEMVGLVILGGVFGVLSGIFTNLCSQKFGNDIRKDCFQKIMNLSFEQTDKFSTGSLVTRVTNDITQIQTMVAMCIRGLVRNFMFFAGGIVCMLMLNIDFGIVIGCALPIVIAMVMFFILKANPIYTILQKKLDKVNGVIQENVGGMRVIKAFVREDYEKKRFENANNELVGTQLRILLLFSYMTPFLNIVMNIIVVLIIYTGSIKVQAGQASPGNVMAAITYVSQILNSVMMIAMVFQNVSRGMVSAKRLTEVLESDPVIEGGTFDEPQLIHGKIEFRDVSFTYPNNDAEMVLNHINLVINPGETIAIMGSTGSGKSSLVNLIPRFYDTVEGSVLVDDMDVREYPLNLLRNKIAITLQKSELFSSTISENIGWGKENATMDEIKEAAEIAQADEFIMNKQDAYNSLVTERGTSLSGGQKQRIAISRAILKKAEILIFDDSTSALDLKTEAKLYDALKTEYMDMTKIIIAQRIASVRGANRIIVLDNGKIVACDTHENLLKSNDIYQDIYNSQLGGKVENE